MSKFGLFLKELREKRGLSLREFCRLANLDPGNWSKVERGIFPPPKSRKVIDDISSVLLLERGSEERETLFDLAAIGHIPSDFLADRGTEDRMTVFFRAANSSKDISAKEIRRLIGALRGKADALKKK
jgi:transcriptional regulator with XRE-family HTH domain